MFDDEKLNMKSADLGFDSDLYILFLYIVLYIIYPIYCSVLYEID